MSKWRRRDIILLLERLDLYISAGLPLDKTLELSAVGISKKQARIMAQVQSSVEAGDSLSQSLEKYVGTGQTTSSLVRQGENSGELTAALQTATALLEREDELVKKCVSAMVYPVVIGTFAGLLTIGLVRGVMPQIIPMLLSLHVSLPLITRIVICISQAVLSYGLYLAAATIVVGTMFVILIKKVLRARRVLQVILLHTPIVGGLIRDFVIVTFLRSCGSLIESGMPVSHAFEMTSNSITLLPIKSRFCRQVEPLSHGMSLGSIMGTLHLPAFISPIIMAGEASGTLGKSMVRAATILDRAIEHSLKKLTSLIEPVMMAGMGTVVGGIALSIMMPIYDISRVLQQH